MKKGFFAAFLCALIMVLRPAAVYAAAIMSAASQEEIFSVFQTATIQESSAGNMPAASQGAVRWGL